MYHTRNFIRSLSEAYSGHVHNFTPGSSAHLNECHGPEVWGATKSGVPYERWNAGYVDTQPETVNKTIANFDQRRSFAVKSMFLPKEHKPSKTQQDMLYRVESEMVDRGSALLEDYDSEDTAAILTAYLQGQGLNPDPYFVQQFVDLLEDADSAYNQQSTFEVNPTLKSRRRKQYKHGQDQQASFEFNKDAAKPRQYKHGQDQQAVFTFNKNAARPQQYRHSQDQQAAFTVGDTKRPLGATSRRSDQPTSTKPRDERKPKDGADDNKKADSPDELQKKREELARKEREANMTALASILRPKKSNPGKVNSAGGDITGGRSTRIDRG